MCLRWCPGIREHNHDRPSGKSLSASPTGTQWSAWWQPFYWPCPVCWWTFWRTSFPPSTTWWIWLLGFDKKTTTSERTYGWLHVHPRHVSKMKETCWVLPCSFSADALRIRQLFCIYAAITPRMSAWSLTFSWACGAMMRWVYDIDVPPWDDMIFRPRTGEWFQMIFIHRTQCLKNTSARFELQTTTKHLIRWNYVCVSDINIHCPLLFTPLIIHMSRSFNIHRIQ